MSGKMSKYREKAATLVRTDESGRKSRTDALHRSGGGAPGIVSYNWWNEAAHGVARAGTATVFPQAIGMATLMRAVKAGRRCDRDRGTCKI